MYVPYDSKWHHGRVWFGDRFHIEWRLGRKSRGLGLTYQQNTYNPDIVIHIAIKWLFQVFFVFGDVAEDKQPRQYGIKIHDWLFNLYYGGDPDEYGDKCISFFIDKWLLGRQKTVVAHDDPINMIVPMPEGDYPVIVQRVTLRHWRNRTPFYKRIVVRYDIESESGIPIPGKGENSWDLDDNAIFSAGYACDTSYEALAKFAEYILERRLKYGGEGWIPDEHTGE